MTLFNCYLLHRDARTEREQARQRRANIRHDLLITHINVGVRVFIIAIRVCGGWRFN